MASPRIAIITGGAQGIGHAIALRLARDGLDIVVNDLASNTGRLDAVVKEIHELGRKSLAVTGDVSSQVDVQNLVDVTVKEFGGFDVFVANAAASMLYKFVDTPVEVWDKLFAINARGTFLCYQAAAAQFIKQGRGGRIIGGCSAAGKKAVPELAAYSSTKFAIRGLTQAVAQELGMYGITVNAYAPGLVDTEFLHKLDAVHCEREGIPIGSLSKAMTENIPYGNLGTPEDIAGLVSYIASPEAKFVTGQCLNINGGSDFD